jgi:hypothetical protein
MLKYTGKSCMNAEKAFAESGRMMRRSEQEEYLWLKDSGKVIFDIAKQRSPVVHV